MNWFMKRLREPSTWKGLLFIASMAGYNQSEEVSNMLTIVGPQFVEQVTSLITLGLGAWEVIRREKKETPSEKGSVVEPAGITTPPLTREQEDALNRN